MSSHRYPTEHRTLALTLLITVALVVVLSPFTLGGAALVVGVGFVMNAVMIALAVRRVRRSAQPIDRFPDIAELVERCRLRLKCDDPLDVYVVRSSQVNAYAIGMKAPYTIVLYSGLIEALNPEELTYVIGHEIGHIQYRHTTILGMIGQLGQQTFGIPLVGLLIRGIFLFWMRVTEYTADRAGLLACEDLEAALSTQLKLALGEERAQQVDIQAVIQHWQAHDVSSTSQLGDVLSTHPGAEARMDKLVDFARALPPAKPR